MKVEFHPAYVLHARPFKDSSLILDCLTKDYGRISLVAKGARSPKARQRQLCQPFLYLLLSWQGKRDLKTLTGIESAMGNYSSPQGEYLFSGLYLNELLTRLLSQGDASPDIFERYHNALKQLCSREPLEPTLRQFELGLLYDLGYGVDLHFESNHQTPLQAEGWYRWQSEAGWLPIIQPQRDDFAGADLLAIALQEWTPASKKAAKRLTRMLLQPHLGDRPLQSRKLFLGGATHHKDTGK